MSKITTEDCKQFLLLKFPNLANKDWKRTRKYKDENSNWCRDFEHKSGEFVTLIEINNELVLSDAAIPIKKIEKTINIKDPNKVIYYRQFSPELVKACKKIVKKATDYDEDEEFEIQPEMKGYEAIPNCFRFFFVGDCYNLDTKITKEVYFEMKFAVFFSPITTECYDQHLDYIIGDFLPSYYNEECECQFTPHFENNEDALTIRQILEQLSEIGFIYEKELCDLKEDFKDYTFIPKKVELDLKQESLSNKIIEALKEDNSQIIEDLIKSGEMPVNYNIKSVNILNHCYKNDKFNCFNVLIKNIDNLAEYNKGMKNIFEILTYSLKDINMFKKYFNAILENASFKCNDYAGLLHLIFRNLEYNQENVSIERFKSELIVIKKFFTEEKYKEFILFAVLAYKFIENDKELLNIALSFIDDYKQDAITPTIDMKIYIGNDVDYDVSETILNKLIEHKLKIGGLSIEDFIKTKYENYYNRVSRKNNGFIIYMFDQNGNQLPEDTTEQKLLSYWKRQMKKIKDQ